MPAIIYFVCPKDCGQSGRAAENRKNRRRNIAEIFTKRSFFMKFDIRYSNHPDDSKRYDTQELREKYLIEKLFEEDEILLTYSHQDRIIAGGAMPVKKTLSLGTFKELATAYFLERREMGVINIGGAGIITLDGKK